MFKHLYWTVIYLYFKYNDLSNANKNLYCIFKNSGNEVGEQLQIITVRQIHVFACKNERWLLKVSAYCGAKKRKYHMWRFKINFKNSQKNFKKGVDKGEGMCYYNQALAREGHESGLRAAQEP